MTVKIKRKEYKKDCKNSIEYRRLETEDDYQYILDNLFPNEEAEAFKNNIDSIKGNENNFLVLQNNKEIMMLGYYKILPRQQEQTNPKDVEPKYIPYAVELKHSKFMYPRKKIGVIKFLLDKILDKKHVVTAVKQRDKPTLKLNKILGFRIFAEYEHKGEPYYFLTR
jgi:hypothetical protein